METVLKMKRAASLLQTWQYYVQPEFSVAGACITPLKTNKLYHLAVLSCKLYQLGLAASLYGLKLLAMQHLRKKAYSYSSALQKMALPDLSMCLCSVLAYRFSRFTVSLQQQLQLQIKVNLAQEERL